MPDTPLPFPTGPRVPAREAFAALPLEGPRHPAWPAVAARAQRAHAGRRRRLAWLAVAASAVLVAVWVPRLSGPGDAPVPGDAPPASTTPLAATGSEVDTLIRRSQALEARLWPEPPALRSGSAALAADWIAADIGTIDAALAESGLDDAPTLWQARIALLGELDDLRRSEAVAATGGAELFLALD